MQKKLIKSILTNKIKGWADHVEKENKAVADTIRNETIVLGGAISSMLTNNPVNDYDVYFKTRDGAKRIIEYYVRKFQAAQKEKNKKTENDIDTPIILTETKIKPLGFKVHIKSSGVFDTENDKAYRYFESESPEVTEQYFGNVDENLSVAADMQDPDTSTKVASEQVKETNNKYAPVYVTQNAITLTGKLQIVTRFYGEPEEIIKYFDFEHCKQWYTSWDRQLHLTVEALECLMNKRLVYTGSEFPICSVFRIRKFLERGYRINAGQILKMAMQISHLDLTDPRVLEEQLIGVDHAYFQELLNELIKKKEADGADKIDETYLVQLIDKYF